LEGTALDRDEFYQTRNMVYDMLGWDRQTASPKRWKLYELGLTWVAEQLEQSNYLVD